MMKQEKILTRLQIYGIDPYTEAFILTSLLTGDPCMMIGRHGSAKTELVKEIGAAINSSDRRNNEPKPFTFQIYDASKLSFEDLVGYPNAKDLMEDKMTFVHTPLTIWGKDLIGFDEANRASPEIQNNLLEIIRSRKCNGLETGTKFIYATINPYGSTAVNNMAEALVDRFVFFISFKDFSDMNSNDRVKIINRVGDVDSIGLRHWGDFKGELDYNKDEINHLLADVGDDIKLVLKKAAEIYPQVQVELGNAVNTMIIKTSETLNEAFKAEKPKIKDEVNLSGRRAGMIKRAILGTRAMQLALNKELKYTLPDIAGLIKKTLICTIPLGISNGATPENITRLRNTITILVDTVWPTVYSAHTSTPEAVKIFETNNKIEKLALLLTKDHKLDDMAIKGPWSDIIGSSIYMNRFLVCLNNLVPNILPSHIAVDRLDIKSVENEVLEMNIEDVAPSVVQAFYDLRDLADKEPDLEELIANFQQYCNLDENKPHLETCISSFQEILTLVKKNSTTKSSTNSTDMDFMKAFSRATKKSIL